MMIEPFFSPDALRWIFPVNCDYVPVVPGEVSQATWRICQSRCICEVHLYGVRAVHWVFDETFRNRGARYIRPREKPEFVNGRWELNDYVPIEAEQGKMPYGALWLCSNGNFSGSMAGYVYPEDAFRTQFGCGVVRPKTPLEIVRSGQAGVFVADTPPVLAPVVCAVCAQPGCTAKHTRLERVLAGVEPDPYLAAVGRCYEDAAIPDAQNGDLRWAAGVGASKPAVTVVAVDVQYEDFV